VKTFEQKRPWHYRQGRFDLQTAEVGLRNKLRKAKRQIQAGDDPDRVNDLGKNVAGGMETAERAEET
jgi:hypothetical protein